MNKMAIYVTKICSLVIYDLAALFSFIVLTNVGQCRASDRHSVPVDRLIATAM